MNSRIIYLDFLRIISCLSVIMVHVSANELYRIPIYDIEWQAANFYHCIVRFCVPIFVMISGVFFLEPNRELTLKHILNKNIFKIARVFVCWSLIYTIYNITVKDASINSSFFIEIMFGNYHMWFLFMIVGLYIITPFLRIIATNKTLIEYFIFISFIFCYVGNLLMIIPKVNTIIELLIVSKMKLFFIQGFTGYFFTGYYLNKYDLDLRIKKILYIGAIISIIVTILISSYLSIKLGKVNTSFQSYLLPNTFIISSAIFTIFKDKISNKKFSAYSIKLIKEMSILSLGVYMIHILFVETFFKIKVSTIQLNTIIYIPLITIVVFILSNITIYIMKKIPFIKNYI